ncbi:hypothetical protein JOF53_008499 [Crossiella equi]|uniref:Lipoprotein n=1 Tax=Crossiella equi TaxID=130796 RepID=A0ABS5ATP0_9PSEU|nr:hypothetical protein [Crossiella equi]MBP2479627.1 hypothetical protein [Crossiella equi]
MTLPRIAATAALALPLLAGCAAEPVAPLADRGAGALGQPVTTMRALVNLVNDRTSGCVSPKAGTPEELGRLVGAELRGLVEPHLAEWSSCAVPPSYPKVGLLLFAPGKQTEFQRAWREAMTKGAVADAPMLAFGNGFAVTSGFLGVYQLDLYYLRCAYADDKVRQIPADVDDCVFAQPPAHQH